ncbi:MAG: hypothetical protein ACTSU4_11910 [Promethearchaeota archaeon]
MNDCIDTILDFYNRSKANSPLYREIWTGSYLVKLMEKIDKKDYEKEQKILSVRNCLILLINLFFGIKYPDHYHAMGKSVNELSIEEKKQIFELLKAEINNKKLN